MNGATLRLSSILHKTNNNCIPDLNGLLFLNHLFTYIAHEAYDLWRTSHKTPHPSGPHVQLSDPSGVFSQDKSLIVLTTHSWREVTAGQEYLTESHLRGQQCPSRSLLLQHKTACKNSGHYYMHVLMHNQ